MPRSISMEVLDDPKTNVDLDIFAIQLDLNGQCRSVEDICFYNNATTRCGRITMMPEKSSGITMAHPRLMPGYVKSVVFACAAEGDEVSLRDAGKPVLRSSIFPDADLDVSGKREPYLVFGEFKISIFSWNFHPRNIAIEDGMNGLLQRFGLE